ncbi:MAG: hypothetical protein ACRD2W_14965 [Acidimicrobiales bacterium]
MGDAEKKSEGDTKDKGKINDPLTRRDVEAPRRSFEAPDSEVGVKALLRRPTAQLEALP